MSACPKCHAVFMTFPHTCGLGTPHMAEFVPVEEKPEEYIRQVRREPTAYDRAQNELSQRIATLDTLRRDWEKESEHRIELLRTRLEELWEVSNLTIVDVKKLASDVALDRAEAIKTEQRLDAALRRIEALELEVARLKDRQTFNAAIDLEVAKASRADREQRMLDRERISPTPRPPEENEGPLPDEGT